MWRISRLIHCLSTIRLHEILIVPGFFIVFRFSWHLQRVFWNRLGLVSGCIILKAFESRSWTRFLAHTFNIWLETYKLFSKMSGAIIRRSWRIRIQLHFILNSNFLVTNLHNLPFICEYLLLKIICLLFFFTGSLIHHAKDCIIRSRHHHFVILFLDDRITILELLHQCFLTIYLLMW